MNLIEFQQKFATEEACLAYLVSYRWRQGRYCPHCGLYESYAYRNGVLYKCKGCRAQFTVKVGTIFNNSKVELTKWFLAIFLLTSSRRGISSVQLGKYLGVTQRTAWRMLHRIRQAIHDGDSGMPLTGRVEVDETYIGGKNRAYQRGWKEKQVVFGAIERGGKIRIRHVRSSGARVLIPRLREDVADSAVVYSDQYGAYSILPVYGFEHQTVNHGRAEYVRGSIHTQNIEAAWSHLKRSIFGVYYRVSRKHLQGYCSEFEFRYNTRKFDDIVRFHIWFKFMYVKSKAAL